METTSLPSHILLVDDNSRDLGLLSEAFTSIGSPVEIETCTTGYLAFANLQSAHLGGSDPLPDLLIFDIRMPGISGVDLLHAIKGSDGLKDIPVVMLATVATQQDRDHCNQLGAVEVIEKPSNFTAYLDLARHLTGILNQQK